MLFVFKIFKNPVDTQKNGKHNNKNKGKRNTNSNINIGRFSRSSLVSFGIYYVLCCKEEEKSS